MYKCEILLDSINPWGGRLTTMRLRFPRFVLAEFNTHRQFSRNAGSSRAIPVERRIEMIEVDPVYPEEWGEKAKTMHATQEISEDNQIAAVAVWATAAEDMVRMARILNDLGVHKQVVNRLLEPFSWVDVIVTSTEWQNFFDLRISPYAQPEIRTIAEMMRDSLSDSTPTLLSWGAWHIPTGGSHRSGDRMVAVGRLARVSYETDKDDDEANRQLAQRLLDSGHWSPFEHIAMACHWHDDGENRNFARGWMQMRAMLD